MKKQVCQVSPNTNLSTPPIELTALSGRSDMAKSVSRLRTMLLVALLTSGATGLAVNFVLGQANPREADAPQPTLLASAGDLTSSSPERMVVPAGVKQSAALRFRKIDATAPADPFEPSVAVAAIPKIAPAKVAPKAGPEATGASIEAAAQAAADAAAPAAEEISLVGIIQGDPALAVVKYDGQSFFLKIGEQVADTWRLEQIGERSATFSLGKRRVEVPLREGSSS
jgi:hypothetical protein